MLVIHNLKFALCYSLPSVVKKGFECLSRRKSSAVSEFQRTHAYISPEIFSKERSTGEVQ